MTHAGGTTVPRPRGLSAAVLGGGRRSTAAPRPTPAADRRRTVEARLIGIPAGPEPSWWPVCWQRGAAPGRSPQELIDATAASVPGLRVLHHVGLPGTTATVDHVVIGPGGVVVANTERCVGRVRSDGVHLKVRGRDRSTIVDVALWRAEAVRATLTRRGLPSLPVHGVLHWEHVDALADRPIALRGVPLLSAGGTVGLAAVGVALSPLVIERAATALACDTLH